MSNKLVLSLIEIGINVCIGYSSSDGEYEDSYMIRLGKVWKNI